MMQFLFCIKDDVAGQFSNYGTFLNKAVAAREFSKACDAPGVPAADLSLYESASFDTDTGVYDGYATPVFVARGKKNEVSD